ncbi:MAG: TonB-dependent receptor, partial [Proteobacteria bacterium]|nr:TonB-dependent receptor [Pseudomonadota bacterium]
APQKRILLSPIDAVQWTITIPPLIDPHTIKDVNILRAYNLLTDGEIREANNLLMEITRRQPASSLAWSILALSSLALGEKQQAIEAAEKGIESAPQSVSAYIVQSYVFQGMYDLDRAMAATKKALAIDKNNVLALINLAKLQFATDYIDQSLETIKLAEGFAPQNAEIQNLIGFILIAKQQTQESVPVFKRASQLDPGLGEPHMGLGIAYMRLGDIATSLEEITTAVLLEPQRAIFLSYWAKMLYQIKRFKQALDILKFAQKLDPNDPTPELYKAIILRDMNLPTEAIASMNSAVNLNDNRAVYRSRFLLDRDLAVKNVDLSILYNQLGMTAWAKNKAMASIKQDYSNSSAHLFYAGSVRDDGDRSWIYSNEMLLARMLMPANLNSFNSFNEYTPFFEQPSVNGTITGSVGSFKSSSSELVAYGGIPNANIAFGGGASYADTDGWQRTNYGRMANLAGMVKWDATPKDKFMFVASYLNAKQGDKWYPAYDYNSQPDPYSYRTSRLTNFEIGYNRQLSPNSNLLVYLSNRSTNGTDYSNIFRTSTIMIYPPFLPFAYGPFTKGDINTDYEMPYYQGQLQYMHKFGNHQLIAGTVQYSGNSKSDLTPWFNDNPLYAFTGPTGNVGLTSSNSNTQSLQSYYAQDTWKLTDKFTLEFALYYDRMKDGWGGYSYLYLPNIVLVPGSGTALVNVPPTYQVELENSQWSPRAGLIFTPTKADTFRFAAFRYLMPFLSSRLDPSDIAGIPIYRNASWGTSTQEVDLVWEHGWSTGFLSTNLFYQEGQYAYSLMAGGSEFTKNPNGYMRGFEMTLNQLIWKGLGLNAGYRYKNIDYLDDNSGGYPTQYATYSYYADREEHQLNAGLKYLHQSGFSCGINQIYRHDYLKTNGISNENIWLTDVSFGYELPGKRGMLRLEVRNLFNNHFNWVTDYYTLTGRDPERGIYGSVSLNF